MRKHLILMVTALLLLLSGCASTLTKDIKTEVEVDPTVKFSGYKSYAWLGDVNVLHDPEGKWQPPEMNVAADIKFLIDRELRKRGIYSHSSNPDLAVLFFMGVDMENQNLKTDPDSNEDILENVPAAGLVVALIDTKSKYVVWLGGATGEIQQNRSEEEIRERLDYAVTQMFKELPKD